MSHDRELVADTGKFTEVLEARIEAREGMFEEPHPFLKTAMRGLAGRLGDREIVPMGFVNATELYIYDLSTGVNGFTGEPMPAEVSGMPSDLAGLMIRMTADVIVHESFGDEFAHEVKSIYGRL